MTDEICKVVLVPESLRDDVAAYVDLLRMEDGREADGDRPRRDA